MKTLPIFLLFLTNIIFSQQEASSGYIALTNEQILEFKNLIIKNEKVTFYNTPTKTNYNVFLYSVNWIKNENGTEVYKNPSFVIEKSNATENNIQNEIVNLKKIEPNEIVFMTCNKIQENGVKLTSEQLKEKFKFNSEIIGKYNSGKGLRTAGNISFFGGLAILLIEGSLNVFGESASGEKSFNIMWLGVGGVVVSIPLLLSGKSQIKQAVDLYNASMQKTTLQFNLKVNRNGLGLCASF